LKKSKHSPKKLPSNQTGLYLILDPYRVVEGILVDWYEKMVLLVEAVPPSSLLWGDYFEKKEIFQFIGKINDVWDNFDNKAYFGLREPFLMSLFEDHVHKKDEEKDDCDYLTEIGHRVGCYKSLLYIKPLMRKIILRKKNIFINKYNDICVTPGQPENTLLRVLIQDIERVLNGYFIESKNKTYRSVLAFYFAKQDILTGLRCKYKESAQSVQQCSGVDCLTLRRKVCRIPNIRDFLIKKDIVFDTSKVVLCAKSFKSANCKVCVSNLRNFLKEEYLSDRVLKEYLLETQLLLSTPCRPAIKKYNDIVERIKKDKYDGRVRGTITDIENFRKKLKSARLNNDRKAITSIYNDAQELYSCLTRKKIQRILSK